MKWLDAWDRKLTRLSEDRFYLILLVAMILPVASLVAEFALGLHRNFLTIACDTAAVQNAIVNTLHGNWFRDTAYDGPNLLGLHTMLVLLLVAPVYAIFPYPETLFILQVVGIYSAVIPLYLVALDVLRRPLTAFLVAATALTSPLLFHMALAPFHPESWILAAVLWSCFFYRRNQLAAFWVSFGFAVCCGEQAALIYLALGTAWWWMDDGIAWRKRYGAFALAGGLGWLIFAMVVVLPLAGRAEQHNLFAYNYSNWGIHSAGELVSAMVRDPLKAFGMMLLPGRWIHVAALVGAPLLLAFFSLRSLLLLLPIPFYFLMSDQEFYLYFHAYYFQFAFVAGYLGLLFFLAKWKMETRLGTVFLTMTVFFNVLIFCAATGFYQGLELGRDDVFSAELRSAFKTIPPDAGVYSPHRYSAYLSNRENMVLGDLYDDNFDFKKMLDARVDTTDVHPEQIDYIISDLINDQCGLRQGGFNPDLAKKRAAFIEQLLKSGQWQMFWNQNNVIILKRIEK